MAGYLGGKGAFLMIFGGGVVSRARRPTLSASGLGAGGGGSWFRTILGIGFWGDSIRSWVLGLLGLLGLLGSW